MLFLFYDGILEAIHIHKPGTAAMLVLATLSLMIEWAIGSRNKAAQRKKQMHAVIENTRRLRAEAEREAAAERYRVELKARATEAGLSRPVVPLAFPREVADLD